MNIMILDTETISLENKYIYDLGYIIVNVNEEKEINILKTNSLVIKQIYDNKILFSTAFYKNKRKFYINALRTKKTKRKHFGWSMVEMKKDLKDFNITKIFAYNSNFDMKAFEYSRKYFKTQYILKNIEWVDILVIANNFIHNRADYKNYCIKNNAITKNYGLKVNAEVTYSFLTGNKDFKEEHMAIADCKIELEILKRCLELGYSFESSYKRRWIKVSQEEIDQVK